MSVFLLTWNPSKWLITDEEWADGVQRTTEGDTYPEPWSVGSRRGGIEAGDRLFLVRVHRDRGIVASGVATSRVYPQPHWDRRRAKRGDTATYVDVEWDWQVAITDRIPVEVLLIKVPNTPWNNLVGSGVKVQDTDAGRLLELWEEHSEINGTVYPDEVGELFEGRAKPVRVNRFERNPRARAACLAHFGAVCAVCGFTGSDVYGPKGTGLIHVHHVTEMASQREEYVVDPIKDLVPVCPTCHAMIHSRRPAYSPREVQRMLRRNVATS